MSEIDFPIAIEPSGSTHDLSGRDRMVWNVLASWVGQIVFVVAGFVMPRFIDRHIGQTQLGIWDFGWSLVSYLGLAQVGIGSSVNRYVAKYRARGDTNGINQTVASVMMVQILAGALVLILTAGAAWLLPLLFHERLGDHIGEARWVVCLLGFGLSMQMFFDAFNGVITGCHRWDLHNAINAGFYAATVIAMLIVLSGGGGLRGLAMANAVGTTLTELSRVIVAHHVCPELRLQPSLASWACARRMFLFGSKSALNTISRLLLYQTNSVLIVTYLGPPALALFSRPKSLVSQAQTFINKFGYVLIPTASSLHADEQREELRQLLLNTSRLATYLALPMVLVLSIMGGPILHIWMGSHYEQSLVLAVLALGHLTEMTRQPIVNILAGMNMHGRLGLVNLCTALLSVILGYIALSVLHGGLLGAALSIVIPLVLVNGTFIPMYACRRIGVSIRHYIKAINQGPFLCSLPFAACLLLSRMWFSKDPVAALLVGCGSGSCVLAILYWRFVLPDRVRQALMRKFVRRPQVA